MFAFYLLGAAITGIALTLCILVGALSCPGKWSQKLQSIAIYSVIWPVSAITLIGEFIKFTSACLFDE